MGCPCNEKTAVLKCNSCGRMQSISYSKKEDPLEVAKKEGRKCKTCYSTDFTVASLK